MESDVNFGWLMNWFNQQCDGDWEKLKGITIGNIDNPGWFIKIDIEAIDLKDKVFDDLFIKRSVDDWIACLKRNGYFEGCGGPNNLTEIIKIFRDWAESKEARVILLEDYMICHHGEWDWLFQWYKSQCDEDWEHEFGVNIQTSSAPGWEISIDLVGTELMDKHFSEVFIDRSEHDWIACSVKNNIFEATCGSFNLSEVLHIFRLWVESQEIDN